MAHDPQTTDWPNGLLGTPASRDADGFADDILFEASALAKPIKGKTLVAALLAATSSIYESLEFTAETTDNSTTYLQWRLKALVNLLSSSAALSNLGPIGLPSPSGWINSGGLLCPDKGSRPFAVG
jgi:hypothetical protein